MSTMFQSRSVYFCVNDNYWPAPDRRCDAGGGGGVLNRAGNEGSRTFHNGCINTEDRHEI